MDSEESWLKAAERMCVSKPKLILKYKIVYFIIFYYIFNKFIWFLQLSKFVKMTYPVLLLVWFNRVDEAEALDYFEGRETLNELLTFVNFGNNGIDINTVETMNDLDDICQEYNLYDFV